MPTQPEEIAAREATRDTLRGMDTAIAASLQSLLVSLGEREALNDTLVAIHPSEALPPTYVGQARLLIDGSPNLRGLDLVGLAVPVVLPA